MKGRAHLGISARRFAGWPAAALVMFLAACSPRAGTPPSPSPLATTARLPSDAVQPPAAAPAPAPARGQDFGREARLLFRVVACAGDEPLPAALDAEAIREHCNGLQPLVEKYRTRYLSVAGPFLSKIRPAGLPGIVVYPFGGGDLLSALTTYPDATEITTLSLELAGDPRRLGSLPKEALVASLGLVRQTIAPLLSFSDSTSQNLMKGQRGEIPGQIAFFLVALAVHGQEPVSLRFFRIETDGSLHYYSGDEIAAADRNNARSLKGSWTPPDFNPAFANVEIAFRARGAAAGALRIHRHIAANLADGPLKKDPSVLRHLEMKGRVAAMTKAASYLLWRPDFTLVREYLLGHMELMISDTTGIPPSFAGKAGFVQDTYGSFRGSFLPASKVYNDELRNLWDSQPARRLPIRYGYPDSARSYNLLVTRKRASAR
jgi:hypothetical protein